jgi:hypothetical protein
VKSTEARTVSTVLSWDLVEFLQEVHTLPGQEGSQLGHSAGRERARRLKLTPIQEKAGDLKRDGHKHNTHTYLHRNHTKCKHMTFKP